MESAKDGVRGLPGMTRSIFIIVINFRLRVQIRTDQSETVVVADESAEHRNSSSPKE